MYKWEFGGDENGTPLNVIKDNETNSSFETTSDTTIYTDNSSFEISNSCDKYQNQLSFLSIPDCLSDDFDLDGFEFLDNIDLHTTDDLSLLDDILLG